MAPTNRTSGPVKGASKATRRTSPSSSNIHKTIPTPSRTSTSAMRRRLSSQMDATQPIALDLDLESSPSTRRRAPTSPSERTTTTMGTPIHVRRRMSQSIEFLVSSGAKSRRRRISLEKKKERDELQQRNLGLAFAMQVPEAASLPSGREPDENDHDDSSVESVAIPQRRHSRVGTKTTGLSPTKKKSAIGDGSTNQQIQPNKESNNKC